MSFGGFSPESSSRQDFRYAPQSATGQGVNIRTGAGGVLGPKNSGNITLQGKSQLYINQTLGADAVTGLSRTISDNVSRALAQNAAAAYANDYTKTSIGQQVLNRTGSQIEDAPAEEKKNSNNIMLAIGAFLLIGLAAAALGWRKR